MDVMLTNRILAPGFGPQTAGYGPSSRDSQSPASFPHADNATTSNRDAHC